MFKPDKFSNSFSTPQRITDVSLFSKIRLFLNEYDFLRSTNFELYSIGALDINSSNYKIVTDDNQYLLKILPSTDLSHHIKCCNIAIYLSNRDFPVGQVFNNKHGDILTQHLDKICSLWQFYEAQPFSGTFAQINSLSNYLLPFSTALSSLPVSLHPQKALSVDPKMVQSHIETFLKNPNALSDCIPSTLLQFVIGKRSFFQRALDDLSVINRITTNVSTPVHFDLHPHNILMSQKGEVVAFIDIDSIINYSAQISYSFCLFKLYRQYRVQASVSPISFTKFAIKLMNTSDPLSALILAKFEIFRRIAYILSPLLKSQHSPWVSVLEIQLNAIIEIEFLLSVLQHE